MAKITTKLSFLLAAKLVSKRKLHFSPLRLLLNVRCLPEFISKSADTFLLFHQLSKIFDVFFFPRITTTAALSVIKNKMSASTLLFCQFNHVHSSHS
jgi:hypothetical protein